MKVEVKLFATLRKGRQKRLTMELETGATPATVMNKLDIKPGQVTMLMINGIYNNVDKKLEDGDVVSLLPPVGGG